MKTDPDVPRLILDYFEISDKFGPPDFADFVALWHAADALMKAGIELGFDPSEVRTFLLSDSK